MLTSIEIKNFQSHKHTTLDLVPGVNLITGHSDCGKSVILRALYWVHFNRPSGDSFRSTWGGDTSVELKTSDGHIVTRGKGSENVYTLDGEVQKAMGTDVPEIVSEALNIDADQIQRQMDAPFLLSLSSSQVAQVLNRVVRLDIIETVLRKSNASVRENRSETSQCETDLETLTHEYEQFAFLDEVEPLLARLKKLEEESASIENQKCALSFAVDKLTSGEPLLLKWKIELKKQKQLIEKAEPLLSLVRKIENELVHLQDKQKGLVRLADKITMRTAEVSLGRDRVERWKKELKKIMPKECPLCGSRIA